MFVVIHDEMIEHMIIFNVHIIYPIQSNARIAVALYFIQKAG
jgi:hypothetical protein